MSKTWTSTAHTFIIVATDYFTKWVEASAVRTINSAIVKKFIETEEFAIKFKIMMIQFSLYYPQSNC